MILVWLDGGPSHMDLYDLKPEAPPEYRGLWQPIPTNVPGIEISELFPLQAKVADKFSIVRSLHHNNGDHFTAGHIVLTSRGGVNGADQAGKYPSIGSIVAKTLGPRDSWHAGLRGGAVRGQHRIAARLLRRNYLGREHNPFETDGDPNSDSFKVQNLNLPTDMSLARLEDRQTLFRDFDRMRRDVDSSGALDAMSRFQQDAYDLVSGEAARKAFDISSEDPKLRDRYGRNS